VHIAGILLGREIKVTGILHNAKQTGIYGANPSQYLTAQLEEKIVVQGQHAKFIRDTDPFKHLGVTLTMKLHWSSQHKSMTNNLISSLPSIDHMLLQPKPNVPLLRASYQA